MYDDDVPTPLGLVPVEGRGSLPFALLHGESLVAVASWALGDAGVRLGDFTDSWAELQSWGAAVVVHDPLCAGTPVGFLTEAVRVAVTTGALVVGVRPVTDTVATTDGERLGATVDRDGLLAVTSPVVVPAAAVAALPALPSTDDLAELVVALRAALGPEQEVTFLEAPPSGRRISDESDLRLVEALRA